LAAICKKAQHECTAVDLQVELDAFLASKNLDRDFFADVFFEQTPGFDTKQVDLLHEFISHELSTRKVARFDYVIVSHFSYLAQAFGNLFLPCLRTQTNAKIVIGGAGMTRSSQIPGMLSYPEQLKLQNSIDEYIIGEAEEALPRYFDQQSGSGIGNWQFEQIEDLDTQVWPDYDFYDLSRYATRELSLIGSRGCVRKCTFCDVARTTPKYRFRSGKNIAQEIMHHHEKHGTTSFYFTDSLVNGSFKAFNDMCEALSAYDHVDQISWSGQYIIRSRSSTPISHFDNLVRSGCDTLFVGLESGCDRIRHEMGKKFSNDDVEFYLENFAKRGIKILFLFFTGYPGETEEDYQETLSMFSRWQRYVATGTIVGIETINLLSILPDTPLEQQALSENFLFLHDGENINRRLWVDPKQPDFDFRKRVERHIGMMEEAMRYKWPLWNGNLSLVLYEQSLRKFNQTSKVYHSLQKIHMMKSAHVTQEVMP
jgi:radical SAM superfamily enzyme YgiQ (UPF0313 family)